jgi:3'(2'), 5'-bisphosphate nucleotidase
LDPIDGTKGFLRGDQYAIALALVEQGQIQLGVLGCPALTLGSQSGVLLVAVRGMGTRLFPLSTPNLSFEDAPVLQVVQTTTADQFRFVESVEAAHGNQTLQETIARSVGITAPSIRMDSQAKYGTVAAGEAALYLRLPSPKTPDYREKIWDHAAGAIVIEEAGGKVTDMHGKPLDFSLGKTLAQNQGVIASNGTIHDTVLEALRQEWAIQC